MHSSDSPRAVDDQKTLARWSPSTISLVWSRPMGEKSRAEALPGEHRLRLSLFLVSAV
jgi:hypothetical protein